jgi:hypothetical protein
MIIDTQLILVPPSAPISLVSAVAGYSARSFPIDETGQGVGTAPLNIIGTRTVFGSDMAVGWVKPRILITVGATFATSTSATLNVQFQGSIDSGSGGTPPYSPNAWGTYSETGPIAVGNLTANSQFRMDFATAIPYSLMPRFLSLNFAVGPTGSGIFTAGTIASAVVAIIPDDYKAAYAVKNYVAA